MRHRLLAVITSIASRRSTTFAPNSSAPKPPSSTRAALQPGGSNSTAGGRTAPPSSAKRSSRAVSSPGPDGRRRRPIPKDPQEMFDPQPNQTSFLAPWTAGAASSASCADDPGRRTRPPRAERSTSWSTTKSNVARSQARQQALAGVGQHHVVTDHRAVNGRNAPPGDDGACRRLRHDGVALPVHGRLQQAL